jgi:hypothetical protein
MKTKFIILLISSILFRCIVVEPITPNYNFPKEIAPYVDKFLLEGKKRGLDIDLKGLKIFYQDSLPYNQYQGYYYPNTHSIYIKKGIEPYLVFNEFPEELIMHELGHGILKRDHIYDKLENGDFKSVMATPYVGWSRNREKEQHYYDELFDKSQFNTLK